MDISGPFDLEHFNMDNIKPVNLLVMMDLYSKFVEIELIYEANSLSACKAFQNGWLLKYGPSLQVLCDSGVHFTSNHFRNLCQQNTIKLIHTSTGNPQGNGVVERVMQTINEILQIFKGT